MACHTHATETPDHDPHWASTLLQASKLQLDITDVQLRLTPLEEVFTAVARQAEVQHAQHTKHTTELVLGEGNTLQVIRQLISECSHASVTVTCA